jgi:hypothetical protein
MAFQPFLANRATVTGNSGNSSQSTSSGGFQRLFESTTRPESGKSPQTYLDAPKVDLIEENGRVASIIVTCRCCERIELACKY